jgi:iron complex transport system substrate-binding protein
MFGVFILMTNIKSAGFLIRYLCLVFILNFVLCDLSFASVKPRYISLAPSTTEILFALGLDEEIVGVSSYCNYPLKAKTKDKVGTFSQPNIEKIIFLKPDYIFCTGLEQSPAVSELKRLNLNVFVSDPSNIRELLNSIWNIGKITGKEKEAQGLISKIKQGVNETALQVKPVPENKRPKVFIEIWHDPLTTAGKGSFIDELLTLAGGINIAHDTLRPYSIFSVEEVVKRNPDCIIFTYMDQQRPKRLVGARLGWNEISAVKNNRLYNDIEPDLLLRPGPRVSEGLKEIHKRLYP